MVEAKDFFVNEALLTGEAFPTEKHAIAEGVREPEISGGNQRRLHGKLRGQRHGGLSGVATGPATQLGAISRGLRHAPPPAALEQGIHEFGMLILRITVCWSSSCC